MVAGSLALLLDGGLSRDRVGLAFVLVDWGATEQLRYRSTLRLRAKL